QHADEQEPGEGEPTSQLRAERQPGLIQVAHDSRYARCFAAALGGFGAWPCDENLSLLTQINQAGLDSFPSTTYERAACVRPPHCTCGDGGNPAAEPCDSQQRVEPVD
ncbi:MAG: hypothetical protein ACK55I_43190, partial [bacterium]